MNRHYVLFDEDIQAGCNVEYMSEECAAIENEDLEQEGESVRWIPYGQYVELAEKKAKADRERHSSTLRQATTRFSK